MAPLDRLISLPSDVLAGLRMLPEIADSTSTMAEKTAVLPQVEKDLHDLCDQMARVAESTSILDPMDDRMSNIEAAMPVLVEVQKSLTRVPDTLERLDEGLNRISESLDKLLDGLGKLDENLSSLHEAIGPQGRIAQRLPGGSRAE